MEVRILKPNQELWLQFIYSSEGQTDSLNWKTLLPGLRTY